MKICNLRNLYFAKWATSSSVSWFSDNLNSNVRYILCKTLQSPSVSTFDLIHHQSLLYKIFKHRSGMCFVPFRLPDQSFLGVSGKLRPKTRKTKTRKAKTRTTKSNQCDFPPFSTRWIVRKGKQRSIFKKHLFSKQKVYIRKKQKRVIKTFRGNIFCKHSDLTH